jgi:hypothetical protein
LRSSCPGVVRRFLLEISAWYLIAEIRCKFNQSFTRYYRQTDGQTLHTAGDISLQMGRLLHNT